jgi:hypothetical protein
MIRCGRLQLVLFGALWLAATSPGSAQIRRENDRRNEPFRDKDVEPDVADPQAALARRLGIAQDFGDAERIAEKLLAKPELLKSILGDPEFAKLRNNQPESVKRIAKDLANKPEFRKKLEEGLKKGKLSEADNNKLKAVFKKPIP